MSIQVGLLTWGLGAQGAGTCPSVGVSIYNPRVQTIHLLSETTPLELKPSSIAKDADQSYVPGMELLEPIPETNPLELRPSTVTEEEED
jgi:hypothetical protein